MDKRLSVLLMFVATVSLVVTSCQPAQPVPDANAAFQTAVASQVARDFELLTLTAVGYTPTPAPTQTPRIEIQTVVVTVTPMPSATLSNILDFNCGIRWQIDFIVDNYNAMDPKRLNDVGSRLLNHFDIKNGKLTFTKPGIKDDETKIGQILDAVKGAWVPDWQGVPSAYKDFHNAEVAYLESMIEASRQGRKGDLSEAYSDLLNVNGYGFAINGNYLSHVCGYNFKVPTRP